MLFCVVKSKALACSGFFLIFELGGFLILNVNVASTKKQKNNLGDF